MADTLVTWLEDVVDAPRVMSSPFDDVGPPALARHAALALQAQLAAGSVCEGVSAEVLREPDNGKMFGVLVVRDAQGRHGVLRAFSGQLAYRWDLPGYVPPLFDRAARAQLEADADVLVKGLTERVDAFSSSSPLREARARLAAFDAATQEHRAALKAQNQARKDARRARRPLVDEHQARALDNESRADDRARRDFEATARAGREAHEAPLRKLERHGAALERLRRLVSQEAMRRLHDTYVVENALGQRSTVRALFAPVEPPWGAGDCAAPKLFAWALRHQLAPVALAEFWWGTPPPGGGRVEGVFFPACKEKCGPLLPFMLAGWPVAPRERYRPRDVEQDELRVVHRDERVVVFDKPAGLLSVPGTNEAVGDSVLARVRRLFPKARGPLMVHRLDLDTSGLLLVALDEDGYRALQAQFIARTIAKRYQALLEGDVRGPAGTITLPLRVDLEQRPRQLVDPVHGKSAVTDWRVLAREGAPGAPRTRVELVPHTGRTHQLRVHCAHEGGLGAPIVGDRLYGAPATRLHLHACSITFLHPGTGVQATFDSPTPF